MQDLNELLREIRSKEHKKKLKRGVITALSFVVMLSTTAAMSNSASAAETGMLHFFAREEVPEESIAEEAVPVEEAPAAEEIPAEPVAEETPAPVEEVPAVVEEAPAEETPAVVEEAPAEETPAVVEEAPAEETPAVAEEAPAEEVPAVAEETPAEETPAVVEEIPAPAEVTPAAVEETPAPVVETPAPVEEAPAVVEETPAPVVETPAVAETPVPAGPRVFTSECKDTGKEYTVEVTFDDPNALPADAQLSVKVIEETINNTVNAEYTDYIDKIENKLEENKEIKTVQLFDITFTVNGAEVEPNGLANVKIASKALDEVKKEDLTVLHFEQNNEIKELDVDAKTAWNTDQIEEVKFDTDSFSVYAFVEVVEKQPEPAPEPAEEPAKEETPAEEPAEETPAEPEKKEEETPAVVYTPKVFTYESEEYNVEVSFNDPTALPEDAEMVVTPVEEDAYNAYVAEIESTLAENQQVKSVQMMDISFVSGDETIDVADDANVILTSNVVADTDNENLSVVRFEETAPVDVNAEAVENTEDAVQFEANPYSVYAIVGTETITGGLVSADGSTYEVNVTYGSEAGIPKGSTLKLVEYAEGSLEYQQAKNKVDEYREEEANAQEEEMDAAEEDEINTGFSALGISILDPDGNEIEPKGEVSVVITMKTLPEGFEAEDLLATMEVHHLAETDGAITVEKVAAPVLVGSEITANDNGAAAEFVTNSFSTYTVSWGNGNQNTTTLHFVDENGQELTGVKLTSSGTTIDGTSINLSSLLNNNTTMDLRNAFTVDGKTLSNTHIGSYQNLGPGNARQIVANEIQRQGNNFRYRTFHESGDDSGSAWNNIANGSNLYLVYSDVPSGGGGGGGTPDDPDAPDFGDIGNSKTIDDNNDGTYTLNLSVTGQAQSASENNHVNVAIVLDTSSSMTSNGRTRLADAKRALVGTTQTEIQASIAHQLLSNNTTDDPAIVELAFLTFDRQAHNHTFGGSNWTTNEATYRTTVNGVGVDSGTNWEDAMRAVGNLGGDGDPTYVIFLTDGQPSRYWTGTNPNPYVDGEGCMLAANDEARALIRDKGMEIYGIFAWGSNDNFTKDYLGKLITYAYNDSTKINHRYNASGTSALVEALEEILNTINMNFGFADVAINDGITGLTSTEVALATVQSESFEYTITYVDAADNSTHTVNCTKNSDGTISIPSVTYNVKDPEHPGQYKSKTTEAVTVTGASYANGRVQWHLEKSGSTEPYILEEAWTYKVSFVVWPSQHAYDLVAALNNDQNIWGHDYKFVDNGETITFEQYQNQITGGPYGPFSLKTNTDASVSYKEVTAKTTDEGTTYTYSDPKTVTISYNDVMKLTSEEMTVEKLWYNPLDSRPVESQIELSVTLDGKEFLSHLVLDRDNDYKHNAFIACGIITEDTNGYDVKETGHDFTFTEVHDENAFYWNLEAETYRPMLINGTLTLLIKVDTEAESDYKIGNDFFKKGPEGVATIQATNVRRSRLNLRKFVTDETDGTVDPDAEFTYTITINEASGEDIYFSVFGANGEQYMTPEQGVKVSTNVIPKMMQDDSGEHQYYVVPSGQEFTVNAKAGWSLMFLNLSNGTTYTISESMPDGFELGGEAPSANEYYYATPGDPSSRTTRPVAHNMTFSGVTASGSITQSNTQYRVDYTNVWKSKDVTLVKVKEDGQTEIGGAEFSITKKNANGMFDSVTTFTSSTDDDVLGEVFKLGYGIYCLTETKAPDGYIILTNKIYFNVTTEGIVLCDENGNTVEYENAVVSGDDLLTVTIKNTPGAALPMTGGSGTLPYTLGGMTLMMAAALMYILRMRRERRLS